MALKDIMGFVSVGFEIAGVATIVGGFLIALGRAVVTGARPAGDSRYEVVRRTFGRSVLLGLEVLVAADLIRTIAVDPTLQNLLALGLLVVIRTFLSFSLDIELEGTLPWRKNGQ